MLRWRLAGVAAALGLLVGGGAVMRVGATVLPAGVDDPAHVLHLFYTPPVLVRAGEPVKLPVDVVCATEAGEPCPATVGIEVDDGSGRAARATAEAVKGLAFDLSAPAVRTLGSAPSGSVGFRLYARSGDGKVTALPAGPGQRLRAYVTREMPVIDVPAVPFGDVRRGRTVLFLPWGSGPLRAGLSPGREAATLGPTSFDVDASGRIHVVDALQGRVAAFQGGRLAGEVGLPLGSPALISVGTDGGRYILDEEDGSIRLRSLSRSSASLIRELGPGIVSQLRVVSGTAFANVLPLDGWISEDGQLSTGMPLANGRSLVRVATEESIRVGTVRAGRVSDAVELRSSVAFGGVALTELDPAGGYLLVVRTWRDGPEAADQFQVIRVGPNGSIATFAIADRSFAQVPPLARFRLGPDGALYQMTSSPEGMRIVRIDLEVER